ncbi:polynucleotide kinase 3'-phosphatase [Cryptococcus bacillisporus CA1280]|uniref:polynucleotide kinase 3'-phosphatase n=1 Tax=Cryptococcus bacillisporus CA1280 TaxID=1296109 RepID=UPI0033666C33
MSPQKRASDGPEPPAKRTHPFFTGGTPKEHGKFHASDPALIHFTHLDPFESLPKNSSESIDPSNSTPAPKRIPVAFYDLDGTLVKTRSGNDFPKSRDDWIWWHPSVPEKLKQEWEAGTHLVVISNQGSKKPKIKSEWRAKLPLIAAKMPNNVPLRILAATEQNNVYRKPNIGMFQAITEIYRNRGLEIDMEKSIFVGDAAGRSAKGSRKKDHGNTDYKFAINVGLRFVTPEEYFLGHPRPSFPEPPIGFRPRDLGSLNALPHIVPSHTPITRKADEEVEIVIFVGYPASGKSSFFRKHFQPAGYVHVNQDILRTRQKCLNVAEEAVKSGKSVVIDNTNRNRETRAYWVSLASKLNVPIRLFHFLCPPELAKHNNLYRAYYPPPDEPTRELLPYIAFAGFETAFEEPKKEEGFDEIRTVNFHWQGSEEQRKKWDMYIE